jgi:hypothetical protein
MDAYVNTTRDFAAAFHSLLQLSREGFDVAEQLHECLDMLDETECASVEDALALMTLAHTLQGSATVLATKVGSIETHGMELISLSLASDKYQEIADAYLRKHAGITAPRVDLPRQEPLH